MAAAVTPFNKAVGSDKSLKLFLIAVPELTDMDTVASNAAGEYVALIN